jgi:cell division protein FtsB
MEIETSSFGPEETREELRRLYEVIEAQQKTNVALKRVQEELRRDIDLLREKFRKETESLRQDMLNHVERLKRYIDTPAWGRLT